MVELKKWMVGLDLTEFDDHLIGYTQYLDQLFKPEEIVFVHVTKRLDIPEQFRKKGLPTRDDLLKTIEEKVYSIFKDKERIKCEIHAGTPSFEVWRESFLHHTDLFIAGEKEQEFGRKIMPDKLVRKSFCSVMLVPFGARELKKVWVPTDLSEYSKDALHVGCQIKERLPEAEIVCHYIYETPSIQLIEDDLQDDYRQYYEAESAKKMKEFTASCSDEKGAVSGHFTHWTKANVADHIIDEAESSGADLIVLSSTGKSRVTSLLMGSTSYEMVKKEKKIPMLVVKKRIDKVRAWDVLMNLPV